MDPSQFSLESVLADAQAKMEEISPDPAPPEAGAEVPDTTENILDRKVEVTVKTLITLLGFGTAAGAIFAGEMHPASAMSHLMQLGYDAYRLKEAIEEAHPLIHDNLMK